MEHLVLFCNYSKFGVNAQSALNRKRHPITFGNYIAFETLDPPSASEPVSTADSPDGGHSAISQSPVLNGGLLLCFVEFSKTGDRIVPYTCDCRTGTQNAN